jgi:glycosyltransferase involved in cell wall biosynthesis
MRILCVSSVFLPYVSGLTIFGQRLAEGLTERGHRITVLTNRHDRTLPKKERGSFLVKRAVPLCRLSRGFVSPHLALLFCREFLKNQAVILHLPLPEAFFFAPLAKLFGRKVFLIYHANLNLPSWSVFSWLIEKIVWLNHYLAALWADKIIASSEDYIDFASFLRRFRGKTVAILPPVLVATPDRQAAEEQRREKNLSKSKVIGFAGRFTEEKGGDLLLRAIPLIAAAIPEVKVVFAGNMNVAYEDFSRREKKLIQQFADRLVFWGIVSPPKMAEFYALCDILVLPSRAESFGLVQVEAMFCGCPVVAFDIPGGRVPILMTKMGKLAAEVNPESLAEAVITVLRERKKYVRSRTAILKQFDFQETIKAYEKVFTS